MKELSLYEIELVEDNLQPIEDLESRYADYLDEVNPPIDLGGCERDYSYVLQRVDQIVYDCGFADWLDYQEYVIGVNGNYYDATEVEDLLDSELNNSNE